MPQLTKAQNAKRMRMQTRAASRQLRYPPDPDAAPPAHVNKPRARIRRIPPRDLKPAATALATSTATYQRVCLEDVSKPNDYVYLYRVHASPDGSQLEHWRWLRPSGLPYNQVKYSSLFEAIISFATPGSGWEDASW